MVRKKKSMIGFDPLAWLSEEGEAPENEKKATAKPAKKTKPKKAVAKKAATKKEGVKKASVKKDQEIIINVLGQTVDKVVLLKGYELVKVSLEEMVADFYAELFSQYPGVEPLFENTDDAGRANKLSSALMVLFDNLDDDATLKTVLTDMGGRHQNYGSEPEHYTAVANVLLATCKKHVGRLWTKKINASWETLLTGVAETMLAAYTDEVPEDTPELQQAIEKTENKEEVKQIMGDEALTLEGVQDISKSESLKKQMLMLIKKNQPIKIDASDVSRIDGSALQLLCGLFVYAKANDIELSRVEPSDAMMSSAESLGLKESLQLDYFGLF